MAVAAYKVVVDELAAAIRVGELGPGTRLPTHRELARTRRMALATATRVYAELGAMGLVSGERGRGTFVRDRSGHEGVEPDRTLPVPRVADLSFNQPVAAGQSDDLRIALRSLAGAGELESMLRQQPPAGRSADRAVVATHLLDRGLDVAPDQVVLTAGAQHGLDIVLRALTRPGEVLAADALTYPGLAPLARAHGLEIAPVPVSAAGPDLDGLERLCRNRRVRALYTIPTVHNPLGWVLDAAGRRRLATVARVHDLVLVEDATYAFLDPTAPPPLQTLAPDHTCYVTSFSKNLATGLRFGCAVVPRRHRQAVVTMLRASMWGLPTLVTALAARWIADGTVARLERARRDDAAARQRVVAVELAGHDVTAHPSSYFCWLRLDADVRVDAAARTLAEAGILVSPADAFSLGPDRPHALRLALADPPLHALPGVLRRVRDTLAST